MGNEAIQAKLLEQVIARQQIQDLLHRWTRGADRIDKEIMLSAFTPDAQIDYGGFFQGSVTDFVDMVVVFHGKQLVSTSHLILNSLVRLDGDVAYGECVVQVCLRSSNGGELSDLVLAGRYLDRFERRDDEWKIAHRMSIVDRYKMEAVSLAGTEDVMRGVNLGSRDRSDPSYRYL